MLHDSDATRDKLQATRPALQAFESRREVVGYVRRTATPGWPGTSCRQSNLPFPSRRNSLANIDSVRLSQSGDESPRLIGRYHHPCGQPVQRHLLYASR